MYIYIIYRYMYHHNLPLAVPNSDLAHHRRLAAKRPTRSSELCGSLCRKRHSDRSRPGPNVAMEDPTWSWTPKG